MGWSISTPYGIEAATIDENGRATFHGNTGNSTVYYTVTYTDDKGTRCVTRVAQEGNPCSYVYTQNEDNIPVEGGRFVFGRFENTVGYSLTFSVTAGADYLEDNLHIDGRELVANVKKNTGGTRTIKYKILASGKDCGHGVYTNTQDANDCTCDKLTISPRSLSWVWNNHSSKDITLTYPSCVKKIAQSGTLEHFTVGISADKITVTPNGDNTSASAYRETLKLTYAAGTKNDCTLNVSLVQNVNSCACSDLTLSPTSLSWAWDKTDVKTVTITASSCISDISVSAPTNFTASIDGNTVSINPTSRNETAFDRTGTVTVSYTAGLHSCSSGISVSQGTNTCACGDLTVSPTSLSWNWNETNWKTVSVTSAACVNNIGVNTVTNFTVNLVNNGVMIKPNSQNDTRTKREGTVTISYKAGLHNCSSAVTISQEAKGCVCNCSQVVKVNNEHGEPWYTYASEEDVSAVPYKPTTNVPFAILTASSSFDCDDSVSGVRVSTEGIDSISCVRYDASSSLWNGGWKDSYYSTFREYCSGLASNRKVFIVYGTLGDLPSNVQSRALVAKYKVCDDPCDTTIVNIYQRCACGMDNCKNEYEGLVENRPLYLNACSDSNTWSQGDSICVENLSVSSMTYYEQDTNGNMYNQVTFTPRQIRTMNASKGLAINDDPIPLRVYKGRSTDTEGNTVYGVKDALNESFQVQADVVAWQRSQGMYHYREKTLVLQEDGSGGPMFSIYLHYTVQDWDPYDPETRRHLPPEYGYPYGKVVDGITYVYPLQGMVQYIVDTATVNREQVWEITYVTTSDKIVGGMVDHGKCALVKFACVIYRAPTNHRYKRDNIDDRNKAEIIDCE